MAHPLLLLLATCQMLCAATIVRDEAGVITDPASGATIVTYAARIPTLGPKEPPPGLIVALHGINGNEKQLIGPCSQALQGAGREGGYVVLGLKSIGAGWETVDHEPIRQAVAWAIRVHHVDPRRVFAWGYSHGAIRWGAFAADAQELFTGAVLWAGTCHKLPADANGIAYYVVHGETDPVVTPENIRQARDRMRAAGIRLVYRELTAGDHGAPFSKGRAVWSDHIVWMDALRNQRLAPDEKIAALIAKANGELDADGKLGAGTAKSLFPDLLDATGTAAEDLLIRCLAAPTASLRRSAAIVCGQRLFSDRVIAALIPLLGDSDKDCQQRAIQALALAANLQVAAAQEALCRIISEPRSPTQRNQALEALLPALRNQRGMVAFDPPFAALLADLGAKPSPAMAKLLAGITGEGEPAKR